MKKFITIACLFTILIIESCNKDASQKSSDNSIEGTWELRETSGDMGTKTYAAGKGNFLYFTSRFFQKYSSNTLIDSGRYNLIHDTTASKNVCLVLPEDKYQNRIDFNNMQSAKVFFQISNDSLYLLSGCFALDGGVGYTYVRITYVY